MKNRATSNWQSMTLYFASCAYNCCNVYLLFHQIAPSLPGLHGERYVVVNVDNGCVCKMDWRQMDFSQSLRVLFFFGTRFCSTFQRKVYFTVKGYITFFPELSSIRPDKILADFRLFLLATIVKLCSLSSSEQ